jgi:hypothetical protein
VKNLAEKPLIRNMAVSLDAMTGSSSTTKRCEPEREDTLGPLSVIAPCTAGMPGLSRVSVFLGLTRILFTIAPRLRFANTGQAHVSCCGQIPHKTGVNMAG